jgi:formylglycine-generating enzyme required for sulfatase activity
MASIPRGNNADGPVPGFCLDRLEVTTAAYTGCVNTGACTAEHVREQGTSSAGFVFDPTCNYSTDRMNHPMNCVDWGQAVTYCASKGKRLPSETEFVWAAHGASAGTTYPWGNDEPQAQLCWSGLSRRESTCAGMTFPGGNSPQGVADLAGDVWEWTSSADGSGKVNLGGSWVTTSAAKLAASNRNSNTTSYRSNALGFRCARSLP